ncbi:uncharacterized protein zgc:113229 [Labrus bergylta]|uniref:uncharacterized protein zgc:113229 n=1 Tax=Labrus bergylta TaxID=56723 RepID=UPI00331332DD
MSQSPNPKDSQALLQSMLQRLKLQPGREGQVYLNAPAPNTAVHTWVQDGERGASDFQGVNRSPGNGFEFGSNDLPSKEFGMSSVEIHQPGHAYEVDRGLISFSTHKENTDRDTGENRVMRQNTHIPTGTEQLFPAKSLKDVDISSSERTDGGNFVSSAMISHTPDDKDAATSTGQGQGFTPRVYMWSLKPTESKEDQLLHMGNGGFGAKDMQVGSPGKTDSISRRQQRPAGNKTRRWTQKIKERWRDRQGSFGKKGKEEGGGEDQKREQGTGILPQNQPMTAETLINTPNKEDERPAPSLDSSDPSKTTPAQTEDGINEGYMRSTGDFQLGLGSFSLLEEIVTGQEWAKFLKPQLSATSANQRPLEGLQIAQNPHRTLIFSQPGGQNKQWSTPASDFSMGQTSSEGVLPVGMDVSGGKPKQDVHSEADHSEPMEHGSNQSDLQSEESGQLQKATFLRPADLLDNSALKSRVQLHRKRQHQSAERRDQRLQRPKINDGNTIGREGSISSRSESMKETGEDSRHVVLPLYILNSPQPLSPSSSAPPKGVLKHSISQDSESSMEVQTKRRRVEENRRVRFSEEVQTIPLPDLDLEDLDSEEDSEAEEDSVTEQDFEVEQVTMEEVAPARRPALPAWILALKRRNTGRKPR